MKEQLKEKREIKRIGGSIMVTLDKKVRQITGFELGQTVAVIAEKGKLVVLALKTEEE